MIHAVNFLYIARKSIRGGEEAPRPEEIRRSRFLESTRQERLFSSGGINKIHQKSHLGGKKEN